MGTHLFLKDGTEIDEDEAKTIFQSQNSLRVHISRYHRNNSNHEHRISDLDQNNIATSSKSVVNITSSKNHNKIGKNTSSDVIADDENEDFTKMFATFLIMLEAKLEAALTEIENYIAELPP